MLKRTFLAGLLAAAVTACATGGDDRAVWRAWQICRAVSEGESAELVVDSCSKVIAGTTDDERRASAYNYRALVHLREGRNMEALEDLNAAVALSPDYWGAFNNRGRAHAGLGQDALAIDDFQSAIRLNPDNARAYNNLSWFLSLRGRYAEALGPINKAIVLEPDVGGQYDTKAHALMGLGRVAEAEEAFARSMTLGGAGVVTDYQKALASKGYAPGRTDGVADDPTRAALTACIRDNCRLMLE